MHLAPANVANDIATLLDSLSGFAWPAVVLIAVLLLRSDIQALMARIRRGKGPGGWEFELDKQLDEAQEKLTEASASTPRRPSLTITVGTSGVEVDGGPEPDTPDEPKDAAPELEPGVELPEEPSPEREPERKVQPEPEEREPDDEGRSVQVETEEPPPEQLGYKDLTPPWDEPEARVQLIKREVLEQALVSPIGAFMLLATEVERASREVLSGRAPERAVGGSFRQQVPLLELAPHVNAAANAFWAIRNRVVHGGAASDAEIRRALDIGLGVLDAINSIPSEVNYVVESRVPCFQDELGERPHDFTAVVLEARHGDEVLQRAFPCGKRLPAGEPVSWEWGSRHFPEAWYKDPDGGQLEYGWTESLEFLGRPLHPQPPPGR